MDATLAVPAPTVTQDDLSNWYKLVEQLAAVKDAEMELRKKIFAAYFPNPIEGTNKAPLAGGWIIKVDHKINRTVDVPTLTNMAAELVAAGIDMSSLIKYKPEVAISEYRKLGEDDRKKFDQILVIKEGSPQMEIVKPKRG